MREKSVKVPGPDHPITIERNPNRVVVTVGGKAIADTTEASRVAGCPSARGVWMVSRPPANILRRSGMGGRKCPSRG